MKNADEPAYPKIKTDWPTSNFHNTYSVGGLTKREYFAAMAMQGLLSGGEYVSAQLLQAEEVSRYAVQQADALLAELERTQ